MRHDFNAVYLEILDGLVEVLQNDTVVLFRQPRVSVPQSHALVPLTTTNINEEWCLRAARI